MNWDPDHALRIDPIVRDALGAAPDESMVSAALGLLGDGVQGPRRLVADNLLAGGRGWVAVERAAGAATIAWWP